VVIVLLGALTAVLVIVQARLITDVVVGAFQQGLGMDDLSRTLKLLACVVVLRAIVVWSTEWAAARTGARAKSELRTSVMEALVVNGQGRSESPTTTATLVTRGVDALDGYYSRYLPQLVLAVIVPVAILAVVVGQDLLSAVVIAVTLPLIPLFMVLIGMYTRSRVDRQWSSLARLSGQFLDFVEGLPTLMVFGRAKAQATALREGGERYRSMTMGVLRVSFLSSLVLELLAAIAVALVAVEIGLRLVSGGLTLTTGLFILILAPEAYLPLRLVGVHYHAAAEGLGAADQVFELLEAEPAEVAVTNPHQEWTEPPAMPELVGARLELNEAVVVHPGRTLASLHPLTIAIPSGRCLAVVGASGAGKSTLLEVLAGERRLTSGRLEVVAADGSRVDASTLDPTAWSRQVVLVEQRPHLIDPDHLASPAPSVRAVLAAADSAADDAAIRCALEAVDLAGELDARHDPIGSTTSVHDLSSGQQRRVALARAHLCDAALVLLDEPTSAVDPHTERVVIAMIGQWLDEGRTVVVVAHRSAVLDVADAVVRLDAQALETSSGLDAHPMLRGVQGVGW
jgi:ATP-binding cassette subfamily C protein CydCD